MNIVRYVGLNNGDHPAYTAALADGKSVVIDPRSRKANVVVRFRLDGSPVRVDLSPLHKDFLDLAAAVYVADELARRKDAEDWWTRSFRFLFPVKDPAVWEAADALLRRCLGGLSGDDYEFDWPKRTKLPRGVKRRHQLMGCFDAVCLFSGGIDSLLGAWRLLSAGKRVLLVGHQADGLTAAAQTDLARSLNKIFPNMSTLVQARVSRSRSSRNRIRFLLPEKVEKTHRPRSFLFLSLAVCIAYSLKVTELHIPENGLIALNPPLQVSRIGTLSTRTVHPLYLTRFQEVVRALGVYSGTLKNPFMDQSKTDMLRGIDTRLHPLLQRSVSCARPSRYQDLHVRHCGYCVPCLFRRAAMSEAQLDKAADYAFDVFTQFTNNDMSAVTQADFKALVSFAERVVEASEAELERLVLSHGTFTPGVAGEIGVGPAANYTPWTGMLRRWARHFLAYFDGAATAQVKAALGRSAAMTQGE
jgi:7-cyano-7-deazaguanine synthase in queuosine biosynthesis